MSTLPPPPDRPTEPLNAPAPAFVQERVPVVERSVAPVALEGALASLRTGLAIVGILAVAALGVAIYALLNYDNSPNNGQGQGRYASAARVSEISGRVDRLSRQVQVAGAASPAAAVSVPAGAPAGGDAAVSALNSRVASLEKTVATLSARPQTPDSSQTLAQLSSKVDALTTQVAQLKQTPTTTTTTTP